MQEHKEKLGLLLWVEDVEDVLTASEFDLVCDQLSRICETKTGKYLFGEAQEGVLAAIVSKQINLELLAFFAEDKQILDKPELDDRIRIITENVNSTPSVQSLKVRRWVVSFFNKSL